MKNVFYFVHLLKELNNITKWFSNEEIRNNAIVYYQDYISGNTDMLNYFKDVLDDFGIENNL